MASRRWSRAVFRFLAGAFAAGGACAAGCATGTNAQPTSDVGGAGGGGGASTTASASAAMSSSSSGIPTVCMKQEDCAGLNSACNVGNCVNGMCMRAPANEGVSCDDGKFCTDASACQMGLCVGGTPKTCPSPDSCHVGVCDEVTKACSSMPGNDGSACDDGNACTYSGTCSAGTCSEGPPIDCSNFNSPCGDGVCDPLMGCYAKPKNDGSVCDDGLYCTVNDTCANGVCSGVPNTCAAPGDVCLIGTCDEVSKSCKAVPGNNGVACDDNNACTSGETCLSGTCGGGAPANPGGVCNDGKVCTQNDVCGGGVCAGTPIVACVSNDGCCPAGCTLANDNDCNCNVNIALMATASTSGGGVEPSYGPPEMNNGIGKSCVNTFSWVTNDGIDPGAWIELTWPTAVTIASFYVETESGVSPMCELSPRNIASATVEWWNGSAWVTSTQFSGKEGNIQIDLPSPVTTTQLRLMDMKTDNLGTNSVIWEWHVYGSPGCMPPP